MAVGRLTIMGLSSQFSTFFQMYSGSVRSTGLTDPNGDSRILDPVDDDGELWRASTLNVRTATYDDDIVARR